jgi:hypothetical protein
MKSAQAGISFRWLHKLNQENLDSDIERINSSGRNSFVRTVVVDEPTANSTGRTEWLLLKTFRKFSSTLRLGMSSDKELYQDMTTPPRIRIASLIGSFPIPLIARSRVISN